MDVHTDSAGFLFGLNRESASVNNVADVASTSKAPESPEIRKGNRYLEGASPATRLPLQYQVSCEGVLIGSWRSA